MVLLPSSRELSLFQQRLRQYDKALRLRVSQEQPNTILIERKTFRGKYGVLPPSGLEYSLDAGRRREEGHVPVGSVPAYRYDPLEIMRSLQAADTWRHARPLWRRVEEQEESRQYWKRRVRSNDLLARTHDTYDRYVWKVGSRVSVPVQIG